MDADNKERRGRIKAFLNKFNFRTGVIILALCVPFYILSFAQMSFAIGTALKGVLWVIFFGLAKTFQYAGLVIIGAEGVKRLKGIFKRLLRAQEV